MAHRNRWFTLVYLLKMVIFHGYVKYPDGKSPLLPRRWISVLLRCAAKTTRHIKTPFFIRHTMLKSPFSYFCHHQLAINPIKSVLNPNFWWLNPHVPTVKSPFCHHPLAINHHNPHTNHHFPMAKSVFFSQPHDPGAAIAPPRPSLGHVMRWAGWTWMCSSFQPPGHCRRGERLVNGHFRNLNWRYLPYNYKAYVRPM